MSMIPVIAIDPGGTTGIAIRIAEGQYVTCTAEKPEQLYDMLKTGKFSHVIVETFQAQFIGKWGLHTVRIVGGCFALAYEHSMEYVPHMPQDRYPFQKDAEDILKKRNSRPVIHEHDALAHLLRWEYDYAKSRK